jgi:hypothetical protein
MIRSKRMVVASLASLAIVGAGAGPAVADPASPDNGCHGYYTTLAKAGGDRGIQGSAIGGLGASDGDAADGQAHSEDGRGETLQAFLAATCGK